VSDAVVFCDCRSQTSRSFHLYNIYNIILFVFYYYSGAAVDSPRRGLGVFVDNFPRRPNAFRCLSFTCVPSFGQQNVRIVAIIIIIIIIIIRRHK